MMRPVLAACVVLSLSLAAVAEAPPAGAPGVYGKAVSTEINPGKMITYKSTDQDISAYLVTPKTNPANLKVPGVIYVHDIFGMTDFARKQADDLARQGYVVLMPNLFTRLPGSDKALDANAAWMAYDKTPDSQALGDLLAAVEYLEREDQPTAGQPIGVVGHDMGGIYAMKLASTDLRVAAAVNYYGRIIYASTTHDRPTSPVEDLFNLHAPLLSFYGSIDPQIPAADVRALESRLQNNPNHCFYRIVRLPNVGHGFLVPGRQGYNKEAAEEATGKTREFLAEFLRAAPKAEE